MPQQSSQVPYLYYLGSHNEGSLLARSRKNTSRTTEMFGENATGPTSNNWTWTWFAVHMNVQWKLLADWSSRNKSYSQIMRLAGPSPVFSLCKSWPWPSRTEECMENDLELWNDVKCVCDSGSVSTLKIELWSGTHFAALMPSMVCTMQQDRIWYDARVNLDLLLGLTETPFTSELDLLLPELFKLIMKVGFVSNLTVELFELRFWSHWKVASLCVQAPTNGR